jgi:JAB domain-containing protein similar to deubiquitination enzymes
VICTHRYVLELQAAGGGPLHHAALQPDWEPVVQGARLSGLRTFGVWQQADDAELSVEPIWHETLGQPTVNGLRVRMRAEGKEWWADFPATSYFADAAREAAAKLLEAGEVEAGTRMGYAVSAYPADPCEPEGRSSFDVAVRAQPLRLRTRALEAFIRGSVVGGPADPSDFPVVMAGEVLDEVCALTLDAGACETGGVLIGHLSRDEERGELGLEITAQIAARHTVGDVGKLTFTSDTWTDVRAAVALRNAGELIVGYWHSHPASAWCAKCPVERQRVCKLATGFLSADDRLLHRTMFPSAFTQALVITNSVAGLDTRLFGWRSGVLQLRAFHLRQCENAQASRS